MDPNKKCKLYNDYAAWRVFAVGVNIKVYAVRGPECNTNLGSESFCPSDTGVHSKCENFMKLTTANAYAEEMASDLGGRVVFEPPVKSETSRLIEAQSLVISDLLNHIESLTPGSPLYTLKTKEELIEEKLNDL